MIEVSSLTKRFGAHTAVDDVTFAVPAGRVTAFLGPNGAGKSTTMRVLLGVDHASSGEARVGGGPYRITRSRCVSSRPMWDGRWR